MKQRPFLLSFLIVLVLLLSGCRCEHEWIDANCESARICKICESTDGDALGHQWEEATCLAPMTCSRCSQVNGDPLSHVPSDPKVSSDYIRRESIQMQYCQVCETVLDSKLTYLPMVQNKLFVLNAEDMVKRLNCVYADMEKEGWYAILADHTYSDGSTVTKIYIQHNDIKYAEILLKTPNPDQDAEEPLIEIIPEQKTKPILAQLTVYINFTDIATQVQGLGNELTEDEVMDTADSIVELLKNIDTLYRDVVVPVMMTCAPTLTESNIEESLNTYKNNSLISAENYGEIAVEYVNLFSLFISHVFAISASEDYCINLPQMNG